MTNQPISWPSDTHHRYQSKRQRRFGAVALFMILGLALLLSACSGASANSSASTEGQAISLDALPDGLGRGFPSVELDPASNTGGTVRAGVEAPNFYLRLDDGRFVALRDLRGRPVLINFWASWCGPCRLEMPDIVERAQANPDLVVLAVNAQETLAHVEPFVEEFQMTMPVALDTDAVLRNLYQVRGMPSTVFIDHKGKIAMIWTGMLTGDLLQQIIDDIG